MKQKEPKAKERKLIGFPRLVAESIPELWAVRMLSGLLVALLLFGAEKLISALLGVKIRAITSANLKTFFLSWQAPVVILIIVVVGLLAIAIDLFVQILVSGAILRGEKAGFFSSLKQSFLKIKNFLNPAGVSLLVYVLFGVPLVGIGFSVELTERFKLPNFVMSVVKNKPIFMALYLTGCIALIVFGLLYLFAIHAVLLSDMKPCEAKKYSVRLLKKNWKKLLVQMIPVLLVVFGIRVGTRLLIQEVIPDALEKQEATLSTAQVEYDFTEDLEDGKIDLSPETQEAIGYRLGCATIVLVGNFVESVVTLLAAAFVMLFFTKLYLQFDQAEREGPLITYLQREKKGFYVVKVACIVGIFVVAFLSSLGIALDYSFVTNDSEVPLIAHRGGGNLASENSAEGVKEAVIHHCYGTETDIQRTKDGYYIINHDDTFKRMAGVKKAAQDMTLEEIKALNVRDTTGNGGFVKIPTLEEFLDSGDGEIHYFLELKGATADRQMADDVVRLVKEKGLEDDATIISLKYDLIDYVENTYPEMDTGVLFFLGTGDLEKLNCDMLIVEEGMASDVMYSMAHDADKKVTVWTVNTYDGLYDFLDEAIDGVITDKVELAEQVEKDLENRSDVRIIKDRLKDYWN